MQGPFDSSLVVNAGRSRLLISPANSLHEVERPPQHPGTFSLSAIYSNPLGSVHKDRVALGMVCESTKPLQFRIFLCGLLPEPIWKLPGVVHVERGSHLRGRTQLRDIRHQLAGGISTIFVNME